MIDKDIFEDLFVLEMANNHLGSLDRGLRIVAEFAQVARFNNIRATIKLQFRDVDSFIHKDFVDRKDLRYVKRRSTRVSATKIMQRWSKRFARPGSLRRLPRSMNVP